MNRSGRASLYIHVPFCRRKCAYCSFYSVPATTEDIEEYLCAIEREWALVRAEESPDESLPIATIYLGGGTPALLGDAGIARLLATLRAGPAWDPQAEVSMEANPESLDRDLLNTVRAAGVNRLSVGVQSFDDQVLAFLGRAADARTARAALRTAREAGCANLGIDLIYGIPGQSLQSWEQTLREALAFAPQHISCYLLTCDVGTPLYDRVASGSVTLPDDACTRDQYELTRELLGAGGHEHYEISNFARPGFRCRHNEGTWLREPYYGLGPAAHSFNGRERWANVTDLRAYCASLRIHARRPLSERTPVSSRDAAREMIFLGLRRTAGLSWPALADAAGPDAALRLRACAATLAAGGLVTSDDAALRLTPEAYFVSNSVFVELLAALEE